MTLLTQTVNSVSVSNRFDIGSGRPFTLIAGPCVIESERMIMQVAENLKQVCLDLGIHLIFKSSFDKANRTSLDSPRGVGMDEGLRILQKVKTELDLPLITDVHESWQCAPVAEVVDALQIPAFLSRQTDLLLAAGRTGKIVNVKKGQFMAPWDMKQVIQKMESVGNHNVMLCERGSSFGYNNLVVDMTGLVEMSVQKPSGNGSTTGGNRDMAPYLINAALAVGVDAIFAEVHPDPDKAFSDAANQLRLSTIKPILERAKAIDAITKNL